LEAPLPAIVANEKKVTCHLPNGKTEEMDNPLYGYKFHPVYSDFGDGLPNEKVVSKLEPFDVSFQYDSYTCHH